MAIVSLMQSREKPSQAEATEYSSEAEFNSATPLVQAARTGNLTKVKELVESGCDINAVTILGNTAAMIAAESGELEVIKYLASRGANLAHRNRAGWNICIFAAHGSKYKGCDRIDNNKLAVMNWLLDEIGMVATVDDVNTALMTAAVCNNDIMVFSVFRRFSQLAGDNNAILKMASNPFIKMDASSSHTFNTLNFGRNNVTMITLLENNTLEELSYGGHPDFITALISKFLPTNTSIRKLNCQLFPNEAGHYHQLLDFLEHTTRLEELNFYNSNLSPQLADYVLTGLSRNKRLAIKKLCFSGTRIGIQGAFALTRFIRANRSLEELNLAHCVLGPTGTSIVVEALNCNPGTIRKLYLTYNNMGIQGARAVAALLVNPSSHLQFLSVCANHNLDNGITVITDAIVQNHTVTELDFSCQFPKEESHIAAIARMVANTQTLHTLNLSNNDFNDKHGVMIMNALACNRSIQIMHLKHNGSSNGPFLGKQTAQSLGLALKCNDTLKELDLWGQQLIGEGVSHIAAGLAVNRALATLDLEGARISEEGFIAILHAIEASKCMSDLAVSAYHFGTPAAHVIASLLQSNQVPLQRLTLNGPCFNEADYILIFSALRSNNRLKQLCCGGSLVGALSVSEQASLFILETLKYWNCTLTQLYGRGEVHLPSIVSFLERNRRLAASDLDPQELIQMMDSIKQARKEKNLSQQPYSLRFSACFHHNRISNPQIREHVKRAVNEKDKPEMIEGFLMSQNDRLKP